MSNKKQSSLEFFAKMLVEQGLLYTNDFENLITYQKAKAMHQEEITDAYIDGHSTWGENANADEYYKETFGGSHE